MATASQSQTPLSGQQAVQYITAGATQRHLDPYAVLAVAQQEGIGGGIGDNGSSFGPWQLHVGGAFPSTVNGTSTAGWSAEQKQAWAWSPDGIDYALSRIQGVAQGLQGSAAVSNIVSLFERPANPSTEIQGALSSYQKLAGGGVSGVTAGGAPSAVYYTGSGGISATQPASLLSPASLTSVLGSGLSFLSTPFTWIGKVFETIYGFLTGSLLQYLFRLGLIVGGGLMVVVGFGLLGLRAGA